MNASRVSLGDVAEFVNGAAFKPADWGKSGKRILRIQNLTDSTKPYNRTARAVARRYEVEPGDILVSWSATLGVFVWDGPDTALLNQHIFRAVPDAKQVDADYLRHMLADALVEMERHLHGATMKHVNRREFLDTTIPLPPLAEQKRIAGILDAADALRAKRRESLAQLDTLLQSTFLEMFGDPVTNPMGWEAGSLGDVCLDKPAYGSGAASTDYDPALPRYVRITDVDDAGNLSEDPRCAQLTEKDVEKYRLHEGDILFARSGATVGKSYLYRAEHGFCVYAGYMIRFRPDPKILLPEVLFRFTQTSAYWRWVDSNARAVAQPNINAKMYSALPVTRPPLDLQHRFAAIVESVEQQKASQRAHLVELDTLFASLQSRAFRGDL